MISIIIPVVRLEKAQRCISTMVKNWHSAGEFGQEFPVYLTDSGVDVEIVVAEDVDRIGCPRMVQKLTSMARGDLVCFLGDDTLPQDGWLDAALAAMAKLPDGWGLVALNDGVHGGNLATHWLASKRLLPLLDGEFFHTGYRHLFCDNELTERCQAAGRFAYANDAVVVHDHYKLTGDEPDEHYQRAYSADNAAKDQLLFWQRKRARNGFKLAVGFPVVDNTVPVPFFVSIMGMSIPANSIMLTPVFPHGPFPHDLAAARESLVVQAMNEGCSHLLMGDTDQVYPYDTIDRLLAHQKPVVGVRVHRRWPPFDPIFKRGELGAYTQVPDEESFGGKLIEVDATGTGCLLFDMSVFDGLERPWFAFSSHNGQPVGEDIWLCHRLRKAGVPIHIDTGVEVGHMGVQIIGQAMYELYAKLNPR